MAIDLEKFKGVLPYASELFGIYQPMIGWRSERTKHRLGRETSATISAITAGMARDKRFRLAVGADRSPKGPDTPLPPRTPTWLNRAIAAQLEAGVKRFEQERHRLPNEKEWDGLVRELPLEDTVKAMTSSVTKSGRRVKGGESVLIHTAALANEQLDAMNAIRIKGTDLALVRQPATVKSLKQDTSSIDVAVQAGTLAFLATHAPQVMPSLVSQLPAWRRLLGWVDPLSQFDPDSQDAVLSPIGMIHLYRQFFFELESFLGPPVGHVWVSPGGGLEIFEIHTRKTIEQRTTELRVQTMTRSEKETSLEDELATKVASENTSNLSLGVTAQAGVNFGVFQASATVNFQYGSTQKSSNETAHKTSRKQSEHITNEMRRDFKTTFRTTVETQDTSSRKYVLSNTTDKLVNYEFRRKMRQVGVQLQHIGVQMCWQTYVDDPGVYLSLPQLVHIAKRGDLTGQIQPPEAPPMPEPIEKDYEVVFPFMGDEDEMDETYLKGKDTSPDLLFFDLEETGIVAAKRFEVTPPMSGYKLANVNLREVIGTDPEADRPNPTDVSIGVHDSYFVIHLTRVNFQDNPALRFLVTLTFAPTEETLAKRQKAIDDKMTEYTAAKSRAEHEEYVRAVRERATVASKIETRDAVELRAEERATIFERLMKQLRPGAGDETPHVTVELIRAIFDVDKMLYFVSESWWLPRTRSQQRFYGGTGESLSTEDVVDFTGPSQKQRELVNVDPYLITEESLPARHGASLGWLLQLDGDDHRNAFLNSPFVKAVIPIRPGRERAALKWLERANVEGAEGLDSPYRGTEPELHGRTVRQALQILADQVATDETQITNTLATDVVYETGFDPLSGGFVADGKPFEIFDQWIEVLPTEQVVAVEYVVP